AVHLDAFGNFTKDEGKAMADIIHGIAPDAQVQVIDIQSADLNFFQNAMNAVFAQSAIARAIDDLHNAGCDIIVDDLGVASEPYSSSTIDIALDHAYLDGVAYFTAAGNDKL